MNNLLPGTMIAVSLLILGALAAPLQNAEANHTANQIDVCCAWNGGLNDSDSNTVPDLTYSISGGGSIDRSTVRAAVEDWETALKNVGYSFELNEVPSTDKTANIKIKLNRGGGVIAGMAKRSFDSNGFIKSVDLTISLKAFGSLNDQATIAEITRHEMGHALGLGHANFDDLMGPTVGGVNTVSSCDVDGVVAAQHWKLADGLNEAHKPHVTHVGCP